MSPEQVRQLIRATPLDQGRAIAQRLPSVDDQSLHRLSRNAYRLGHDAMTAVMHLNERLSLAVQGRAPLEVADASELLARMDALHVTARFAQDILDQSLIEHRRRQHLSTDTIPTLRVPALLVLAGSAVTGTTYQSSSGAPCAACQTLADPSAVIALIRRLAEPPPCD